MTSPTVTWKIVTLEREAADGYVYAGHYLVTAEEQDLTANVYGSVKFERPENLIPFDQLTEDQLIQWVKDALGSEKLLEIGNVLLKKIEDQKQPSSITGTPW